MAGRIAARRRTGGAAAERRNPTYPAIVSVRDRLKQCSLNCEKVKRCYSLKRNKDFRHVYRKGNSKANPMLVLIWTKARGAGVHVGFSASKKLGNSVVRNRVKRRLRESFGPVIPRVKDGYDLIFIAREPVVDAKFTKLQDAVLNLLRRADLLKKEDTRL